MQWLEGVFRILIEKERGRNDILDTCPGRRRWRIILNFSNYLNLLTVPLFSKQVQQQHGPQ